MLEAPKSWVLRDFHSPNLLWLEEREGIAKVGLLDFQDAVLGPSAYDLASLLQDARVDVPEDIEIALFGRYVAARRQADPGFDANAFARLYTTLAAQRSTKILGIFARLDRRDHKPQHSVICRWVWNYSVPRAGASGAPGARCLVRAQRSPAQLTGEVKSILKKAQTLSSGHISVDLAAQSSRIRSRLRRWV